MGNVFDQSLLNKSRKDKFVLTIFLPEAIRDLNSKEDRN